MNIIYNLYICTSKYHVICIVYHTSKYDMYIILYVYYIICIGYHIILSYYMHIILYVYHIICTVYHIILFERSEFLIATCKKKKTDRLCVWMFD